MTTLKDFATAYVPTASKTENIASLPKVSTNVEIKEKEGTKKDGSKFKYHYVEVDNVEYRVPKTVIKGLQTALKFNPALQHFRVIRKGNTKDDTEYSVEPA